MPDYRDPYEEDGLKARLRHALSRLLGWRPGRSFFLRTALAGLTGLVLLMALLIFVTLPKIQRDISEGPAGLALTILDDSGAEIGSRGGSNAPIVPLAELPPYLVRAFLATEDRRFFTHFGIDMRGLARAMWTNLRHGRFVEGGSTITQQLAKNLYLDSDRTLWRKAQEAVIALWLESRYSKDEILTLYLNRVYMGGGTYGIDAAAHLYFNKSARDVSLSEAAILAGLPKAPSRFAPTNNPALAQTRAEQVLERLAANGDLTPEQLAEARANPAPVEHRNKRDGEQYFVDWIGQQVQALLPEATGRLTIRTTLNQKRQRAAEQAITSALEREGKTKNVSQGAFTAIARDGAVVAMVGGGDYLQTQFNRATQALRQPGSAFKPVVYFTALENGFTPYSEIEDSPVKLGNWTPQNSNRRYAGVVNLTNALAQSINTVAVKLADRVGVDMIINSATRLGISSPIQENLSIALGSSEVSLIELVSAYSTFSTDGTRFIPYGIVEITDQDGQTLFKHSVQSVKVTEPAIARQMTYMMHRVVTSGTGRRAQLPDRLSAGKTGTSQQNRDAWFIGYTGNEIAGVWFGNDDNKPMKSVAGGNFAAVAWHDYMVNSQKGVPPMILAGADNPFPQQEQPRPQLKGFLSQLSGLFGAARPTRVEQAPPPEERRWGSGFRVGGSNFRHGGP